MNIEEFATAKRCECCGAFKPRGQFPRGQARCRGCRRKGWFPPDYLGRDEVEGEPQSPRWGPLPWRYPITVYQQRLLRKAQHGKCACCGEVREYLVVDHCHESGYVRGLLCQGCNQGLGFFRDNPQILRAAAAYLERSRAAESKLAGLNADEESRLA